MTSILPRLLNIGPTRTETATWPQYSFKGPKAAGFLRIQDELFIVIHLSLLNKETIKSVERYDMYHSLSRFVNMEIDRSLRHCKI